MSGDDYLWDKSGDDPEIARLEEKLRPLAYQPRPLPTLVEPEPEPDPGKVVRLWRSRWVPYLTLAACFVGALYLSKRALDATPARLEARRIGSPPILTWDGLGARLTAGEWLETGDSWSARVALGDIGHVDIAPRTRVRAKTATEGRQHLELERGTIHAKVNAPPRVFAVTTPAAEAIDLGCEYTLDVGPTGDGRLVVRSGWVELERCLEAASCSGEQKKTSIVPAGASCEMRRKHGPGTPHFDDAPQALVRALARFDFEAGGVEAVRAVLREARPRDSLTVWHLLSRVDEATRREVYDALRRLAPPPKGVTDADVLQLQQPKLDLWRSELHATW